MRLSRIIKNARESDKRAREARRVVGYYVTLKGTTRIKPLRLCDPMPTKLVTLYRRHFDTWDDAYAFAVGLIDSRVEAAKRELERQKEMASVSRKQFQATKTEIDRESV